MIVVRLAAPLFFANGTVFGDAVKRAVNAAPEGSVQHLVVDMEAVTDVDVTGAEAFAALQEWLTPRTSTSGSAACGPTPSPDSGSSTCSATTRVFDTNRAAIAALGAVRAHRSGPAP